MPSSRVLRAVAAAAVLSLTGAVALAQTAPQAPIYAFPNAGEGTLPWGNVIMGTDGALYGIASRGGSTNCNQGCGLVFRLTPPDVAGGAWTRTTIYSFTDPGVAAIPLTSLVADTKGALYGTTISGGRAGGGTVFRLKPPAAGSTEWTMTVLHDFLGGADGADPRAPLVIDQTGALYGTTQQGGAANKGTVYRLTPPVTGAKWTAETLYAFQGGADGVAPQSAVTFDSDGNIYGTTAGVGAVYKLTRPAAGQTQWTKSTLYAFQGGADGQSVNAGVIFGPGGALYGATMAGGVSGRGTIFRLLPPASGQTQWTKETIYGFRSEADGRYPIGGLVFGSDGAIYGTTDQGGARGYGTIFRLNPPAAGQTAWTKTILVSFAPRNGIYPRDTLFFDPRGSLYGVTLQGGVLDLGTVYKVLLPAAPSIQKAKTEIAAFDGGAGGADSYGALRFANGRLYGTTYSGGAAGFGTIFELAPAAGGGWTRTVIHDFAGGADGARPAAGVVAGTDGALFGTTQLGGTSDGGTVYRLVPPAAGAGQWTKQVLYRFQAATDGANPLAQLTFDRTSGALYGSLSTGAGPSNAGAIFKLAPPDPGGSVWTQTTLYRFTGGANGVGPRGALALDTSGAIYGTTYTGGGQNKGQAFKLKPPAAGSTDWTKQALVNFAGVNGANPEGGLLFDSAGALYGTTRAGGANGKGVVFKLTPPETGATWTLSVLRAFKGGLDGAGPQGGLIFGDRGSLYGVTAEGGAGNAGVAFKLLPPRPGETEWRRALLYAFQGGTDGVQPSPGGLVMDTSARLYGATVAGGAAGKGIVYVLE